MVEGAARDLLKLPGGSHGCSRGQKLNGMGLSYLDHTSLVLRPSTPPGFDH